jgi:hypothetical protein
MKKLREAQICPEFDIHKDVLILIGRQKTSVADPGNFCTDPDTELRIHTSDLWMRIRILLFSLLLTFEGTLHHFPKIKGHKEVTKQ